MSARNAQELLINSFCHSGIDRNPYSSWKNLFSKRNSPRPRGYNGIPWHHEALFQGL